MGKRRAVVFIDGSNWYHNCKSIIKPGKVSLKKLSKFICDNFDLDLIEIRYYNSIPDISENPLKYHQHMDFLNGLEKEGIKVSTRKLQKTSTKEILKEKLGFQKETKIGKPWGFQYKK